MATVLYFVIAGVLGSIPFSLLLGLSKGIDIRGIGSGNPGATNLTRALGIHWGVLAFLLDAGKGYLAVILGAPLGIEGEGLLLAGGVMAVLGHCYSPFLRFSGGKGVATAGGVLACLNLPVFSILTLVWAAGLALIRNAGMASTTAALVAAGLASWALAVPETEFISKPLAVLLLVVAAVVVLRHKSNIASFFRPPQAEAKS